MTDESQQQKTPWNKNLLYILSPCIIAAILSVAGITDSYCSMESSGGWSYLGVIILVPALCIIISIDFVIRVVFKKKILYIWLAEVPLVLAVFLYIHYHFGG
jgi:hypothetical protein